MTDAQGRDHITDAEIALSKDGKILGLRVKTTANLGAYLSTFAPAVPTFLYGTLLNGVYAIGAIHVEVTGVFTNTTAVDAYRGAGRPEACYVLERIVDAGAAALKMDPAELPQEELHPEVLRRVPDAGRRDLRQRRLRGRVRQAARACSTTRSSAPSRRPRASRAGSSASGFSTLHRGLLDRAVEAGRRARRGRRPLRVRQGARAPDGRRDRVHRLARARTGARDDVRAARRRRARHPDGAGRDRPRRHRPRFRSAWAPTAAARRRSAAPRSRCRSTRSRRRASGSPRISSRRRRRTSST